MSKLDGTGSEQPDLGPWSEHRQAFMPMSEVRSFKRHAGLEADEAVRWWGNHLGAFAAQRAIERDQTLDEAIVAVRAADDHRRAERLARREAESRYAAVRADWRQRNPPLNSDEEIDEFRSGVENGYVVAAYDLDGYPKLACARLQVESNDFIMEFLWPSQVWVFRIADSLEQSADKLSMSFLGSGQAPAEFDTVALPTEVALDLGERFANHPIDMLVVNGLLAEFDRSDPDSIALVPATPSDWPAHRRPHVLIDVIDDAYFGIDRAGRRRRLRAVQTDDEAWVALDALNSAIDLPSLATGIELLSVRRSGIATSVTSLRTTSDGLALDVDGTVVDLGDIDVVEAILTRPELHEVRTGDVSEFQMAAECPIGPAALTSLFVTVDSSDVDGITSPGEMEWESPFVDLTLFGVEALIDLLPIVVINERPWASTAVHPAHDVGHRSPAVPGVGSSVAWVPLSVGDDPLRIDFENEWASVRLDFPLSGSPAAVGRIGALPDGLACDSWGDVESEVGHRVFPAAATSRLRHVVTWLEWISRTYGVDVTSLAAMASAYDASDTPQRFEAVGGARSVVCEVSIHLEQAEFAPFQALLDEVGLTKQRRIEARSEWEHSTTSPD